MNFEDMIIRLEDWGMLDVILPFLLIFTITYAVLMKSKILGDNKKPYNKVVAFVMAMAVIIPHVLYKTGDATDGVLTNGMIDIVEVINNSLPSISLIMVASMMVLLLIGVFGNDVNIGATNLVGWIVILSILAVALIFAHSAGWIGNVPSWLSPIFNEDTASLLITILVFGIIIWFITKPEEEMEERRSMKEFLQGLYGGGQ